MAGRTKELTPCGAARFAVRPRLDAGHNSGLGADRPGQFGFGDKSHQWTREGLDETLTVQRLGLTGALQRTLRTGDRSHHDTPRERVPYALVLLVSNDGNAERWLACRIDDADVLAVLTRSRRETSPVAALSLCTSACRRPARRPYSACCASWQVPSASTASMYRVPDRTQTAPTGISSMSTWETESIRPIEAGGPNCRASCATP